MLDELVVRNLGVIEHGAIVFDSDMTVLTGETGAGKTLVVEAISLLLGDRADAALIRVGADEARIDGRFHRAGDNTEVVLSRVIPRNGRSRAYVDAHPVPVAELQRLGASLVDLHGQHAHQSLLSGAAQREALDAFGGIDLAPLQAARLTMQGLRNEQQQLGGDARAREREIDMLKFQLREIAAVSVLGPDEDDALRVEEELLSDAGAHQEAGEVVIDALSGDGGAGDALGNALRAVQDRAPFAELLPRLKSVAAELRDIANDARMISERTEPNPARLEEIRLRRAKLRDLQRKYGESLAAVLVFALENQRRLDDLVAQGERAEVIDAEIAGAERVLAEQFAIVVAARERTGTELSASIEERLKLLAMPHARVAITVDPQVPTAGDGSVSFLLAANPGSELAPLNRVASGGELARIMLALRLALLDGRALVQGDPPDTLLFDEVDAGIGGSTAVAVGRALADMAVGRQVLVVTHLAQVAACARHHVRVAKVQSSASTATTVEVLNDSARVGELARMLAGTDSPAARVHAEELLATSRHPVSSGGGGGGGSGGSAKRRVAGKSGADAVSKQAGKPAGKLGQAVSKSAGKQAGKLSGKQAKQVGS